MVESPVPDEPTRVNGPVRILLMRMEVGWSLVDEDELVMCLNSHKVRKSARFFLFFFDFFWGVFGCFFFGGWHGVCLGKVRIKCDSRGFRG